MSFKEQLKLSSYLTENTLYQFVKGQLVDAVCCKNHMQQFNELCRENTVIFIVKTFGAYSNHCALRLEI
jgi:hypothetical protein